MPSSYISGRAAQLNRYATIMRSAAILLVTSSLLGGCMASPSASPATPCESDGPIQLRPATFASIHVGMTRSQVNLVLGRPDYSPGVGQDYFYTGGKCEVAPGHMAGCGYVIEYRDYSKTPLRDTGRVMSCGWGGIGE